MTTGKALAGPLTQLLGAKCCVELCARTLSHPFFIYLSRHLSLSLSLPLSPSLSTLPLHSTLSSLTHAPSSLEIWGKRTTNGPLMSQAPALASTLLPIRSYCSPPHPVPFAAPPPPFQADPRDQLAMDLLLTGQAKPPHPPKKLGLPAASAGAKEKNPLGIWSSKSTVPIPSSNNPPPPPSLTRPR